MIKRVIDGKAYNTETATLLCSNADPSGMSHPEIFEAMYQTKHGAFFLVLQHEAFEHETIKPVSDSEARKWLEVHGADLEVMEKAFGAFPEAGAAEARTTLRLPATLFQRLVAAADAEDVSVNTYVMRLLERSFSQASKRKEKASS